MLDDCADGDQRVKVVDRAENGHISAASNTGLALATGRWVAFLDHDDLLAPHALALMAVHLADRPDAGVAYSDEDLVDYGGRPVASYFKPAFDPLLLLAQNHVCHLAVVRRDLVEQVGGLREGYEGSQDWDLLLRVTAGLDRDQVVHVPHVLYHGGRTRRPPRRRSGRSRTRPAPADGPSGTTWPARRRRRRVDPVPGLGWNRVSWPVPEPAPLVSIVVRASDEPSLARCLQSIWVRTTYPSYEIVVVTTGATAAAVQVLLDRETGRIVVADAADLDDADRDPDRPGDVDHSTAQPDGRYAALQPWCSPGNGRRVLLLGRGDGDRLAGLVGGTGRPRVPARRRRSRGPRSMTTRAGSVTPASSSGSVASPGRSTRGSTGSTSATGAGRRAPARLGGCRRRPRRAP